MEEATRSAVLRLGPLARLASVHVLRHGDVLPRGFDGAVRGSAGGGVVWAWSSATSFNQVRLGRVGWGVVSPGRMGWEADLEFERRVGAGGMGGLSCWDEKRRLVALG